MRFALFILLLALCQTLGYCQNTPNTGGDSTFFQLQLTGYFSPSAEYRTLRVGSVLSAREQLVQRYIDQLNERELPAFGFSVGADLSFYIIPQVGLSAGIQYSQRGFKSRIRDGAVSYPDPTIPINGGYRYSYEYLDVPVKMKVRIGKRRVKFLFEIGVEANFLQKATETNYYTLNGEIVGTEKLAIQSSEHFTGTALGGAGIEISILERLSVRAVPSFRHAFYQAKDDWPTTFL